jgi:hypothetical protein
MRHIALKTPLAVLLAGIVVQPALAASYCLRNQVIPPQCIYDDPQQCQREAQRQNAECEANPRDVRYSGGFGKYCVVTAGGVADCNYTDYTTCSREAVRKGGACTVSPTRQPLQGPNPYSPVEGN